jgi:hypothetical protein
MDVTRRHYLHRDNARRIPAQLIQDVRKAQQPKASRLDATHQAPQPRLESDKMSMRDRIEDIIWDHCDDGEVFMDAADAILAALPDYDKQQARIEELEASLAKAMVVLKLISGDDWEDRLGEAIDISCEILAESTEDEE